MSGFKKGKRVIQDPTLKRKHSQVLKKLAIAFAIVLVAIVAYIKVQPYTLDAKRERQLESTQYQLQTTKQQLEQKQIESQQQYDEQQKQLQEVQKKLEETEKALQAKRSTPKVYAAEKPKYTPSGNKEQWMTAAGIPADQWWAVDYIVSRESGWNPCAYNPGRSDCNAQPTTACGLAQALPCSKLGPNWTDPVHALKWQYNYVTQRYGGYPQAVDFWKINHWY